MMNKRAIFLITLFLIMLSTFYPLFSAVSNGSIQSNPLVRSNIDFDYRLFDIDITRILNTTIVLKEDNTLIMGNLYSNVSSSVSFYEFSMIMFFLGDNLRDGLHTDLYINRVGDEFPISMVEGKHVKVKLNDVVIFDREMSNLKGLIYTLLPDEEVVFSDGRIIIPLDASLFIEDILIEIILDGHSSWTISFIQNWNQINLNEINTLIDNHPFGDYILLGILTIEIIVTIYALNKLRKWLQHSFHD